MKSKKINVKDLSLFGGLTLFEQPKSTSNLVRPAFNKFLFYSKRFFEQRQYTNNGPNVRLIEERLAEFHHADHCVSFSNGFWALAIAISTLALKNKSEIVMPSLTYRRMADIAAWVRLKPHFCEVEQNTLAMSADTVKPVLNKNTALILGVHPIVNCCDVDGLARLSKETGIPLLFDSVESVYESIESGKIGSFGDAEAFSMHASKLINSFEGGYITTNNQELAVRLKSIRTFGFESVDNVANPGGLNAKLNEIHAAMALAGLDEVEEQIVKNRERYYTYKRLLSGMPGIRLLEFDERYQTGYKNVVVELLDDWPLTRFDTIKILNSENILARAYYSPPLHKKEMQYPYVDAELPLTDYLAERFLNLPCGYFVRNEDIIKIVDLLFFLLINAQSINQRLQKVEL
jgi:dTDP-4-amino-4,6-dideoxygalactose transaminase